MDDLRTACQVVSEELKKHEDFYDAFVASVNSVIKPKETYVGDGCFQIDLLDCSSYQLAEEIVNRISGEE